MLEKDQKLQTMRHSAAHILAMAVKEIFPAVKLGIGPAVENGFYYDFELPRRLTPDDLPLIEKKMKRLVKKKIPFERLEFPKAEAEKLFVDQPHKLELIADLAKEANLKTKTAHKNSYDRRRNDAQPIVTVYKSGKFIDLCRGPHIRDSSEIGAFKLTRIAGAYWRGSEKKPMLQRVYGVAFKTEEELKKYFELQEEAKKRDHRKLGKELELFLFHETAPGSPYWLKNGLTILNELVNFWRAEHEKRGYRETASPLVNKKKLWETSGHWQHYKDSMFIADMGEGEIYGVKPMNCPNAMIIFASKTRSYKDLPLRIADSDVLHRYEKSGTLNGLLRVRSFRQDDSHNFIGENQIKSEYAAILDITKLFYKTLGLAHSFRLGTRPKKFLGDIKTWNKAEKTLKEILNEKVGRGNYKVLEGDAAFYGPKVDILMKDSLGREWQMGTIQLDYQLPQRFNLRYIDRNGREKVPVVIHRVIYGSLERFIGILIEHFAGAFPVWLSPVQAVVIPVSDKFLDYADRTAKAIREHNLRVEVDRRDETLPAKIRRAQLKKIPYMLIVGEKEQKEKKLSASVRLRNGKDLGLRPLREFIERIREKVDTKALTL